MARTIVVIAAMLTAIASTGHAQAAPGSAQGSGNLTRCAPDSDLVVEGIHLGARRDALPRKLGRVLTVTAVQSDPPDAVVRRRYTYPTLELILANETVDDISTRGRQVANGLAFSIGMPREAVLARWGPLKGNAAATVVFGRSCDDVAAVRLEFVRGSLTKFSFFRDSA